MSVIMVSKPFISRIKKINWDFSGSKSDSPFSHLHWHPGRFISQLPAALIGLLSKPDAIVFDPFVGSGTTIVEAQRLGRKSIGIDISFISYLISKSKTLSLNSKQITELINLIIFDSMDVLKSNSNNILIPEKDQTR